VKAWLLVLLLVLAGCRHGTTAPTPTPTTVPPTVGIITAIGHGWDARGLYGPVYTPTACASPHTLAGQPLPDHICTPGAVDGAVTQANIHHTICSAGYTATVRPPRTLTDPFRDVSAAEYGVTGTFELDHLVPLELGGASDTRNLWPEPGSIPNDKDHVENTLRQRVCSGSVTLADAQRRIALDWTSALS
jgi:hypothetical protein